MIISKSKEDLILEIKEAREKAKEITELEIRSELSELKKYSISDDLGKKMYARYFEDQILNYQKLKNNYKACVAAFKEYFKEYILKYTDDNTKFNFKQEELDFIVSTYLGTWNNPSTQDDPVYKAMLFDEIENLGEIVLETSIFKYKSDFAFAEINKIQNKINHNKKSKIKNEFSLWEIALICLYEDKHISDDNADGIANEYGYSSGQKLTQHFRNSYKRLNRVGTFESKQKAKNQIKRIRKIIPHLSVNAKKKALEELQDLKVNNASFLN